MIAYLHGKVIFSDGKRSILLTESGVGYDIAYSTVLREGAMASVFVSHILRENEESLFAFDSMVDKQFFELLLDVNGVGPKSAYALVSSLGVNTIRTAIQLENAAALKEVSGIGPKASARIILELKSKLDKLSPTGLPRIEKESPESKAMNDALLACTELGFKESDVIPVVRRILAERPDAGPELIVASVLKSLR